MLKVVVITGASSGIGAAVIADLIDHPRAEVYTNPATSEIARRYFQDVEAFEAGPPRPPGKG